MGIPVSKFHNRSEGWMMTMIRGIALLIGTPTVTVLEVDDAGMVMRAKGATVPTDADAGYAKGCIFVKTDGAVASTLYINEGSSSSCDFNAMETSASTVTSVTAGDALSGGGTEGAVELDVVVDDSTIEINADALRVKDAGITTAKLASNAATGAKIPNAAIGTLAHLDLAAVVVDHADVSPKEIIAADSDQERIALVMLVATEAAAGGPDIDIGVASDSNSVVDDFGTGAWAVGDRLVRLIRIPAGDNLRATIADAGTAGAMDVFVHVLTPIMQTANLADASISPAKVAETEARTATADGLTTGAITPLTGFKKFVAVTSAAATDAITLPAISASTIGQEIFLTVGANGYELLTVAGSGVTINQVDADGTNQLDVAADTTVRCTQISATAWLAETIAAATIAVSAPDND